MPFGKPDDIRREILAIDDLFRNIGGYIAVSAHALQRDVPVENVLTFIEAVKET